MTISPNWVVNDMEIYLDSPPHLYANGFQQVKITLAVKTLDGREEPPLTEWERNNIKVVLYRNRAANQPPDTFAEQGWTVSTTRNGYAYYPSDPSGTTARKAGFEYFEFYVTCTNTTLAGETVSLAFLVRGENGRTFCTNGMSWYADGTVDTINVIDRNDARIAVHLPKVYDHQQFELSPWSELPVSGTDEARAAIFNRQCTLTMVLPNGNTLALREMTVTPAGMIQWSAPLPHDTTASFVGHIEPGQRIINWHDTDRVPVGHLPLPQNPTPAADKGSFVLCGRVDITRPPQPFVGPCLVLVRDAYGTQHHFNISFKNGDRETLELRPD